MICFRIKEHKVERDVLDVLLIMTQAQVKEGWDSVTATTRALCVLSLLHHVEIHSPLLSFGCRLVPVQLFFPFILGELA